MKTEITENVRLEQGEVFFDAQCAICAAGMRRLSPLFARRGFRWLPMQTPGTAQRLCVTDAELHAEMILLTPNGKLIRGADTWIYLLASVWWLRPLALLLRLPGVHWFANLAYRWVAQNRYYLADRIQAIARVKFLVASKRGDINNKRGLSFVICTALPILAGWFTWTYPAWVFMWAVAGAMGMGLKWITFRDAMRRHRPVAPPRIIIWFAGWIGLDGRAFFATHAKPERPGPHEWFGALTKLVLGAFFFRWVAPQLLITHPLIAGWLGMLGILLFLHFGLFHLLSIIWRSRGIDAKPIMNSPWRSTSLAELWSQRWNTAFSIPARRFLMIPLARRTGSCIAMFLVFLVSGILHEVVISLPARGGFGLPTAYFLFQAGGVWLQNTPLAHRLALNRGRRGWLVTFLIAAVPAYWLFHPAFLHKVILPMIQTITSLPPHL